MSNAKNAIYAARDFIRKGEEAEYTDTLLALMAQLEPVGTLEEVYAAEIMGATWRLRRCRLVEQAFGDIDDLDFDPMTDERTEKQQKFVDRARAQSHLILRRSLAQLKQLQEWRFAQPAPAPAPNEEPGEDAKIDELEQMLGLSDEQLNRMGSFCKPTEPMASNCKPAQQTPRNAPCPCKSGAKYKRCCGKNAPPILNKAA